VARSGEGGSGEGTWRRGGRCAAAVRALLAVCASAEAASLCRAARRGVGRVSRAALLLGDGRRGECTGERSGLARHPLHTELLGQSIYCYIRIVS